MVEKKQDNGRLGKCSICERPDVTEINEALISGVSYRKVSKLYGTSPPTVSRHVSNCLKETLSDIERDRKAQLRSFLSDVAVDLIEFYHRYREDDNDKPRICMEALGAAQRHYEFLVKATAQEDEQGQIAKLAQVMHLVLPDINQRIEAAKQIPLGVSPFIRWALDPVLFTRECLGFEPDDWQADALRSSSKRCILLTSRQVGKSTITSIKALHTAMYQPGSLVLIISRSERQSQECYAKISQFLTKMPSTWRPVLTEENQAACKLQNGSRIITLPGTNPDAIRCYSAPALLIIDEAAYVGDSTFAAVDPMMSTSDGTVYYLSTPNMQYGEFYTAWTEQDNWHRIKVLAHDCPRISKEYLERKQKEFPPEIFQREFMCKFTKAQGAIFDPDLIRKAVDKDVSEMIVHNTPEALQ